MVNVIPHQHSFAVVVVGAMNPAIHHPTWYRITDLLSAEQEQFALANGPLLLPGELTLFKTPSFEVRCQPDRWQIRADEEHLADAVKVAKGVFEKLYHTPVAAFGFHFDRHIEVNDTDVLGTLTNRMASGGLLLPAREGGQSKSASISQRTTYAQKERTIRIEPSVISPQHVFLHIHFHHPTPAENMFDLTPRLSAALAEDQAEEQETRERVESNFGGRR